MPYNIVVPDMIRDGSCLPWVLETGRRRNQETKKKRKKEKEGGGGIPAKYCQVYFKYVLSLYFITCYYV